MKQIADKPSLSDWLRLHLAFLTAKQLARLQNHFGDLTTALSAKPADWLRVERFGDKLVDSVFKQDPSLVEQALNWAQQPDQQIITLDDAAYPGLLREIADPPILLYVRGDASLLHAPQLAVVGSRHASRQGAQIAEDFSRYLSGIGLTITSGLAHGIDAAAHRGALQGIGKTLAVVGTGIDRIYPAANQHLAREIAEQGVIVSEYPLQTKPLAQNFPRRNRIISGMATGCLVVEAALKSGSLITARQAMEQGREVFAIPGSINNSLAKGCHQLIKQGAKLVETAQDILEELAPLIEFSLQADQAAASANIEAGLLESESDPLLDLMEFEPMSLDELVTLSQLQAADIQAQMMMLEIEGRVEALSAARWRRLK
ncbi:DNA-processing protein DprA [Thiomicrospira microaerophila]|uniref:DNA-processing protein DprA n=1 Tax=Thiomicrospira microaerophila TaxID=406020 RepID=UPI00200C4BB3|nr:DNA-processing protein DprA [Thiomicrospira microaerophila]UQB42045.1 DNA-processing protein DprA [Thiomicrospira microaerophila]